MPFKLTVNYDSPWGSGEEAFTGMSAAFTSAISDWTPAWEKVIADVLTQAIAEQFESEGGALGEPWEELKDTTVERRVRGGFPGEHPILQRTERLRMSFEPGDAENIADVSELNMEWGSQNPAAPHHQSGTGRMPARRIVVMSPDLLQRVVGAVNTALKGSLKDAGFQTE